MKSLSRNLFHIESFNNWDNLITKLTDNSNPCCKKIWDLLDDDHKENITRLKSDKNDKLLKKSIIDGFNKILVNKDLCQIIEPTEIDFCNEMKSLQKKEKKDIRRLNRLLFEKIFPEIRQDKSLGDNSRYNKEKKALDRIERDLKEKLKENYKDIFLYGNIEFTKKREDGDNIIECDLILVHRTRIFIVELKERNANKIIIEGDNWSIYKRNVVGEIPRVESGIQNYNVTKCQDISNFIKDKIKLKDSEKMPKICSIVVLINDIYKATHWCSVNFLRSQGYGFC